MKRKQKMTWYIFGMLSAMLAVNLLSPALAAAGKMVEIYTGVSIYIDDVKLDPKDANGNPVEVFIYNGTTYVPLRAVSEAFGKPAQWDGQTSSAYIGKHASDTPAAYLNELDYFNQSTTWVTDQMTKDNLGIEHTHSIQSPYAVYGDITYKLNGMYSRLTGSFYLQYFWRDYPYSSTMIIYGDNRELWRGTVDPNTEPIDIDIDVTGVLELKLEQPKQSGTGWAGYAGALGDVALWT